MAAKKRKKVEVITMQSLGLKGRGSTPVKGLEAYIRGLQKAIRSNRMSLFQEEIPEEIAKLNRASAKRAVAKLKSNLRLERERRDSRNARRRKRYAATK